MPTDSPIPMIQHVRALVEKGYYVFPLHTPDAQSHCSCPNGAQCEDTGKHPRTPGGLNDATRSLERVERWWRAFPDANIGINCAMSGIAVSDVERGGLTAYRLLEQEYGADLPPGAVVQTGGGGEHHVYAQLDDPITNTVKELADNIDTRGDGGYIVAPGSLHKSGKRYVGELPLVSELVPYPEVMRPPAKGARGEDGQRKEAPPVGDTIGLHSRNATLTSLAGSMRRRGMNAEEIFDGLAGVNRRRCDPPLDDSELWKIARSVGGYKAPPMEGTSAAQEEATDGLLPLYTYQDLKARPRPGWVVGGIVPAKSLVAITGAKNSYKTFVAVGLGLAVASGSDWFGRKVKQGPIVYVVGEGGDRFDKRLEAWSKRYSQDIPADFRIVDRAIQFLQGPDVELLIRSITARLDQRDPQMIFLDTFARALVGGEENSARDVGIAVDAADRVKREFGCATTFIHHFGKNGDIRGSSALPGALDCHITVSRDGKMTKLLNEKQKDYRPFEQIYLIENEIVLEGFDELTGEPETSLVLELSDANEAAAAAESTQKVLDILMFMFDTGGATATEWQALCETQNIPRASFFRAKAALEKRGAVVSAGGGSNGRGARFQVHGE